MRLIDTPVGKMKIRNKHDVHVIKEVLEGDSYRRWGDITIKKGDIVVDLGAHIGSFTRLALACGAYVYAIEPHEGNFKLLKENVKMASGGATLLNILIYNGKKVRFVSDPQRNELHRVTNDGPTSYILMQSFTLNDVIKNYELKKISLLKVDIEGSEYEVFRHFRHFDIVEQITMEYHGGAAKLAWLILFLEKKGFRVVWHGGNGIWGALQVKKRV